MKFHYEAPVGALTFSIVLNKSKWNKLSASQQALINKYGGKYMAQKAGNAFDKLAHERKVKHQKNADRKFISLSDAELAKARIAVQPIYDDWVKNTPNGQKNSTRFRAYSRKSGPGSNPNRRARGTRHGTPASPRRLRSPPAHGGGL